MRKKQKDRDEDDMERRRPTLEDELSPMLRLFPFSWDDEGFRGDIFQGMEEQARRMRGIFNAMLERAQNGEHPSPEAGGPYIYGYSYRLGPDGKPQFTEFGNVRHCSPRDCGPQGPRCTLPMPGSSRQNTREPRVDIIENKKTISITAEIPGVSKDDIELDLTESCLVIKVEREDRRYYKEITLPCKVKTADVTASYRNGVLDVVVKKLKAGKKGKRIPIT